MILAIIACKFGVKLRRHLAYYLDREHRTVLYAPDVLVRKGGRRWKRPQFHCERQGRGGATACSSVIVVRDDTHFTQVAVEQS